MLETPDAPVPLSPEDLTRLTEFARSCKAAARVVLLYPEGHRTVTAALERVVDVTGSGNLPAPLDITVLPDTLRLAGALPARTDAVIGELASQLHDHLIGAMTVHPGGTADEWRRFLTLLARAPETLREEGGLARAWQAVGGGSIELRSIDYVDVMRERAGGVTPDWQRLAAACLDGGGSSADEGVLACLFEAAGDPGRLERLFDVTSEGAASEIGLLADLLQVVEHVEAQRPDRVDAVLESIGTALHHMPPQTAATLASAAASVASPGVPSHQRLVGILEALAAGNPPAASRPSSDAPLFSASDALQVPDEYARELLEATAPGLHVALVDDDPPEVKSGWFRSVDGDALRSLDTTLVRDLLRIETRDDRWGELARAAASLAGELLASQETSAAMEIIDLLLREASTETSARRSHAAAALQRLSDGPLTTYLVDEISATGAPDDRVRQLCAIVGAPFVQAAVESLSTARQPEVRDRLSSWLLASGSDAQREIVRLKESPNLAVRRAAASLLRELGTSTPAPQPADLLSPSPLVCREALRALLFLATPRAYETIQDALETGGDAVRDRIMAALTTGRDLPAAPLLVHLLRHVSYRGRLRELYLRAIESLGATRDPVGVAPLADALYQGDWWAPYRSAVLRSAAAAALARIGTPEARAVLERAAVNGSRGVRAAAREHLDTAGRARGRGGADKDAS